MKVIFITLFLATLTLHADISTEIERIREQKEIPGIACAVFVNGDASVYCFGYANKEQKRFVTPQTLFDLASITKVFTTTELALQIDEGKMKLTDPVSKYLKGQSLEQITLFNLATHTASLPREVPSGQDWRQFLKIWNPPYAPGKQYLYSNLGFWVLRSVLEQEGGKSYQQMLEEDLFRPLKMTSTMCIVPQSQFFRYAQGYSPKGVPVFAHALSLKSTASDMLKFLQANLSQKSTATLRHAMKFAQSAQFRVNERLTLGLAWQRFFYKNMLIIDKNGGVPGFSSYIGMIPEKNIGIVILANRSKINSTAIGRELLLELSKN